MRRLLVRIEEIAKKKLDQLLKLHNLPKKNYYSAEEIGKMLDITRSSLCRRFMLYENPNLSQRSTTPPIKSKKINSRRYVNYWDLIEYISKDAALNLLVEEKKKPSKYPVKKIYPGATPCPYCGGIYILPGTRKDGLVAFYCQSCSATGPCAGSLGEALILWNSRK